MKLRFLFFVFLILVGLVGFAYMHEMAHVEIYKSYGINSHIEWFSHFPGVATVADTACPNDSCRLAHNINEAVSYPLLIVFCLIALGFLAVLKSLEECKEVED